MKYKEKYFALLRILILFIKSFVNPFVDIDLTFFDNLCNSFLFEVTAFSLFSKSVFLRKLTISLLLAKFACSSLAVTFSAVNFLNSGVVIIYLSWPGSVILISISLIFEL